MNFARLLVCLAEGKNVSASLKTTGVLLLTLLISGTFIAPVSHSLPPSPVMCILRSAVRSMEKKG